MATISKRGPHQWRARVRRHGYPVQTRTFERKADAEDWANTVESEMARGVWRDHSAGERMLVRDALERYRDEITPTHKGERSGGRAETYRLNALIEHEIGDYALATLTPDVVSRYRDERLEQVAPATVNRELGLLGTVIETAIRDWHIPLPHGNPVRQIRRPRKADHRRQRRLTASEEERLREALAGARNQWLLPAFELALETGMRRGELLGVEWQDVDFDRRVIHLTETKTDEPRDVPLSTRALQALKALPRHLSGRVIPLTTYAHKHGWQRALRRAGVTDLRWHDLRHEAASRLIERGLHPLEVATITGHRDMRMLQRYSHLRGEDLAAKLG